MSNLLAQGKEIKRLKNDDERRQKEADEVDVERGVEERERAIERFETTMMGLEGGMNNTQRSNDMIYQKGEEAERSQDRGVKRKFELDEEEMLQNAKSERAKARKALDDEKVKHRFQHAWIVIVNRILGCKAVIALVLGPFTDSLYQQST